MYGYDQRIELLGSEGLLSAGNMLENTISKATKAGVVSAKPEYFFLERYMRAYAAEWAAFVAAIEARLGRRLAPAKRGRKPKGAARDSK